MIRQFDKNWFIQLAEIELTIFMRYKIDFLSMETHMSMRDFQMFVKMLTHKIEEESKEQKKSDRLMKSLIAIRDHLNYMTFNDVR